MKKNSGEGSTALQDLGLTVGGTGLLADSTTLTLNSNMVKSMDLPQAAQIGEGVEAVSHGAAYAGPTVDIIQVSAGDESVAHAFLNTFVGASAGAIGGPLGLTIAGGYYVTDILDDPDGKSLSISPNPANNGPIINQAIQAAKAQWNPDPYNPAPPLP